MTSQGSSEQEVNEKISKIEEQSEEKSNYIMRAGSIITSAPMMITTSSFVLPPQVFNDNDSEQKLFSNMHDDDMSDE
jgi:ligand-binding sensor protein